MNFGYVTENGVNSNDKSPPSKFILICLLLAKAKVFTILIKGSFVGIYFD